ncbi:cytochrome P450 [Knoellia sinensis KCTC 19936]|uniref:Cytochrome P450 n=1 Tax=Knoellia sinensis KCTC 19936 TaxID=1385520 RepID=A0A0A0J401_9MICO|nr:cytochrome P450 [Knoellia sinensis]KGN31434.1 cytochrome P450 [Knoellia sinensis KCTC 19936]
MSDVDLTDPALIDDPYPTLAEWRSQGPMLRAQDGRWVATTHAAVGATLRDRALGRIWSDWQPVEEMEPFNFLHRNQLMENEPPEHTRMRRLLAGAFAKGHVERMRPRIEELAEAMLDDLDPDPARPLDILATYAEPMPVFVIADLLGVPREDHVRLRDWSQAIVHMYEQGVDETTRQAAVRASVDFAAYVREVIEMRRERPGEDLVSDLIAERDDDAAGFTDDELVATVVLLLNAGHEASVNTFGNGLVSLLHHPDQLRRITSGEVSAATALEELIRFDAPLQMFERTATQDVEIAGANIRAGETVACLMGSANRDADVFGDDSLTGADAFDVSRDPNPHVGFGLGRHFCLGAPLARVELEVTLRRLLARFPSIALSDTPPRRPTWVLRGYESVPVNLTFA